MSDAIEAWFDAAGPRGEELRRVDALVTAVAPASTANWCPWARRRCSATG
jgi:hypothetical protein